MKKYYIFLLIVFVYFLSFGAEDSLNVEDILKCENISNLAFSNDGRYILFIKYDFNKKSNLREGHLYLMDIKSDKKPVNILDNEFKVRGAMFTPDNNIVFMASKGKDKSQLYKYSKKYGVIKKLTDWKGYIKSFQVVGKNLIFFSAQEEKLLDDIKKKNKDDAYVFEDTAAFYPDKFYKLDMKDNSIKKVFVARGKIKEFSVSPNAKYVVYGSYDSPLFGNDLRVFPSYFLYNLNTGEQLEIFEDKYFQPYDFKWDFLSKNIYFIEDSSNYEKEFGRGLKQFYRYDIHNKKLVKINIKWEKGIGSNYYTPYDITKKFVFTTLANGVVNIGAKIVGDKVTKKIDDEYGTHLQLYDISDDGKYIVFQYSTAEKIPAIFYGKFSGNKIKIIKKIYQLSRHLEKKFIAKREIIRWKSENGREIEGILYYPKDYDKNKKYPLMLNIHGGPYGADMDYFEFSWAYYPHILAEKGSFVLFVNYSGSSNYGLDFAESIYKKYYELEIPDILSGIEYLVKKNMVDPDKIGTLGWSNGSILSIKLVVEKPELFKVACCGAGDVNWISDYGNCAFGVSFDQLYFGGSPYDNLDTYIKKSPLFKLKNVITPTIIFFGTNDTNVPTEQGYEHYRALQQFGKAPVRFILFPGEPHSFRKYSHQKRKVLEELAWLDKYFFKADRKGKLPEFVASNTHLRKLENRIKQLPSKNNIVGVEKNNLFPLPVMVDIDSGKISATEITIAQWNLFAKENNKKVILNGNLNYPVTGVNENDVKEYCNWLSEKTGMKYEPVPEKVFRKLQTKSCPKDENTLVYWLGKSPSHKEYEILCNYLSNYCLLKEVASFNPLQDNIYDINGNASEWVIDKSGNFKVLGASAISSGDNTIENESAKELEYIGFRVFIRK